MMLFYACQTVRQKPLLRDIHEEYSKNSAGFNQDTGAAALGGHRQHGRTGHLQDRKSTRLNSSH